MPHLVLSLKGDWKLVRRGGALGFATVWMKGKNEERVSDGKGEVSRQTDIFRVSACVNHCDADRRLFAYQMHRQLSKVLWIVPQR